MATPHPTQRQRLSISGLVQGVGFRPFVYRLARQLALDGWVRNDGHGVTLEIEGSAAALATFRAQLHAQAPPRARIDDITTLALAPADDEGQPGRHGNKLGNRGQPGFSIESSVQDGANAAIGPDCAVCPACLAELFAPANRRYRYALINCTDCGPRYSLVTQLPYDRANTSMAAFVQCPACQAEYDDPAQRRFHAEPNACPACGPRLTLLDARPHEPKQSGDIDTGDDPIEQALASLRRGEIVAIKGLGGFHLACDARNSAAVALLRLRKQREEKPLAVMAANPASLAALVAPDAAAIEVLTQAQRPIVLMRKSPQADRLLPEVAPGMAWLGVMLAYTPLHYLLFHQAAGRPDGLAWLSEPQELLLVMTSANLHGEPLVTDNLDAQRQLRGIADVFLLHERAIVNRCDDSVLRCHADGSTQFLRRARGYAPAAIALARAGAPLLALGAHYNSTLCLVRGKQAHLSPHIGDLDRVANCLALESAVGHLCHLLQLRPQAIAHDCHPDYFSTRLAQQLAARWQVPLLAVQHHHAHIGAILAEHRIDEPVLGLALDGVGLGSDGSAWGGELLRVDGAQCERLGHLRPLALPGGEHAARAPWRMAAAALGLIGRAGDIEQRFAAQAGAAQVAQMVTRMAEHGSGLPLTTSMGRWFDAAAGMLGVSAKMSFQGQAAMLLEGLAERYGPCRAGQSWHSIERTGTAHEGGWQLDLTPLLAQLAELGDPLSCNRTYGAALFHQALVNALADWVALAAQSSKLKIVACGGGCFINAVLARGLQAALKARGLRMLQAQAVPPGDGGLSLGQAWVARQYFAGSDVAAAPSNQKSVIKDPSCA